MYAINLEIFRYMSQWARKARQEDAERFFGHEGPTTSELRRRRYISYLSFVLGFFPRRRHRRSDLAETLPAPPVRTEEDRYPH